MSTPAPPPARAASTPRPLNRKPVQRLASIRNPTPARRMQPAPSRTSINTCPNPNCPAPKIVDDDDKKVCSGCGTVLSDSNIVAEVTFGETSAGAAIVQGTYVGADQSHGRSFGPGHKQRSGMESREITERAGQDAITSFRHTLRIEEFIASRAIQIFKLAIGANFIQGRRTQQVAAVCLYIACRLQPNNTHMLIDFSDIMMMNVFKLGAIYKALLETLQLNGHHFIPNPVSPEELIHRFAGQLEFGDKREQVALDATHIVKRMSRDWMAIGRRPAGICGAALILAARMNNFRRTVREVVYVVKVTEITIQQRLDEFKKTESAGLTVEDFRTTDLESAHDPPAFYRAREGKKARGKKRKAEDDEPGTIRDPTTEPPPTQRRRVDADGFAIPDLPIDPALTDKDASEVEIDPSLTSAVNTALSELEESGTSSLTSKELAESSTPVTSTPTPSALANESPAHTTSKNGAPPKRRGRKPKAMKKHKSAAAAFAAASDPDDLVSLFDPTLAALAESASTDVGEQISSFVNTVIPRPLDISMNEIINESEFGDDPEVINCLNTKAERIVKEAIWVKENGEYLRQQQAKLLKKKLEEESGTGRVIRRRKRRRGRLGDVSYLHGDGEGGSGVGSRASTPAQATAEMLKRRGFSKKINYAAFTSIYDDDNDSSSGRGDEDGSRAGTPFSASGSDTRSRREGFILSGRRSINTAPKRGTRSSSVHVRDVLTPPASLKQTPNSIARSTVTASPAPPPRKPLPPSDIDDVESEAETIEEIDEEMDTDDRQIEKIINRSMAIPGAPDDMGDDEDEDESDEEEPPEEEMDYYDETGGEDY